MIRFDTSTAATAGNIDIYTSASGTADATITSTQRMIIEQGGNVGIGTTSPVNELEVAGTINATAIYMGTNNVSNINYVDIQNQSMVNYIGVVNTSNNNYIVDYVGIQNTSLVNYISTVNTSNNNYIVDYVGIQNTSLVNYIGTVNTTRNNYLTSAYVPYTGANANLDLGANNLSVDTSVFAVDVTNDRVGIGIAAPTELLHLDNSGTSTLFLDRAGTGVRMSLAFGDAGTKKWYMGMPDSDIAGDGSEFFIGTSQTTADAALWIETSGNVGIGTTNPQNTLNVQGDINVTDTDISMYMEGGILVIEG